jgi:hypothetical protein
MNTPEAILFGALILIVLCWILDRNTPRPRL